MKLFKLFIVLEIISLSSLFSQAPEIGEASYYADKFTGAKTASGEKYDPKKFTAAHRTYPFHSILKVTNLANGKFVYVRVNDKGPHKKTRIIDLSRAAAEKIDLIQMGVAKVKVEFVKEGIAGKDPEQVEVTKKEVPSKKEEESFSLEDDDLEDEEEEELEPELTPPTKKDIPETKPIPTKKLEPPTKKTILSKITPYYDYEGKPQNPTGIGLQLGAFRNESFAKKAATRLMLQGFSKVVIEPYEEVKPTLYRVILWGFATEEDALNAGKKLEPLGYTIYFIYRFP